MITLHVLSDNFRSNQSDKHIWGFATDLVILKSNLTPRDSLTSSTMCQEFEIKTLTNISGSNDLEVLLLESKFCKEDFAFLQMSTSHK